MSYDYISHRFYLEDTLGNLMSYSHKSIPNYGIVVDVLRGIYTVTTESLKEVMNSPNDYQWKILKE